jgi:hypothetical protein
MTPFPHLIYHITTDREEAARLRLLLLAGPGSPLGKRPSCWGGCPVYAGRNKGGRRKRAAPEAV